MRFARPQSRLVRGGLPPPVPRLPRAGLHSFAGRILIYVHANAGATRGRTDPPGPNGPQLCEHRPLLRKTSGPSSPECTDPQRWRPSRRQPPPRTGCPSCTVTQAAGRHAMVVAHFFEIRQRRRLRWGRVERRTANGRRSSAGSTGYIAAIDETGLGGATSARPGRPGFPHSVSRHCPRTQLEKQSSTRVAVAGRASCLERGWIAAQLRAAGDSCSPANGTA